MSKAPAIHLVAALTALTCAGCTIPTSDTGNTSTADTAPTPAATTSTAWVTVTAPPPTPSTTWVTVTATPTSTPPAPRPSPTPGTPHTTTSPSSALAALDALPVREAAPMAGYSRAQFGQKYADTNHDGCDARNDALRRDLTTVVLKPGTHGCVVASGALPDPYSGQTIAYKRGGSSIDFEHVVSLGGAWATGAQQLTAQQREQLANDPLNVLMTSASLNRSKGDADASTWLPPAATYRCSYVARQIAVKSEYSLWVTEAESAAMRSVLATCPTQQLPTAAQVAFPPPR